MSGAPFLWLHGEAAHRPDEGIAIFPCHPDQAFAESSLAVTSTTSPSRMGLAIPKKRATTSELLWASIAGLVDETLIGGEDAGVRRIL